MESRSFVYYVRNGKRNIVSYRIPSSMPWKKVNYSPLMAVRLLCAILFATVWEGCKPENHKSGTFPQTSVTSVRNESESIIREISMDIAEELYYAKTATVPEERYFSVTICEENIKPASIPLYKVCIAFTDNSKPLTVPLNIESSIWSPDSYARLVSEIARSIKLSPPVSKSAFGDSALMDALLTGSAEQLEQSNIRLSQSLKKDFTNGALHEEAALVLGFFALREHSGRFFDVRSILSRMTAELALARYFSNTNVLGINGMMAEAVSLTMMNRQIDALTQLDKIPTNNPVLSRLVRVLRARNSDDYRPLREEMNPTALETTQLYLCMVRCGATAAGWAKLPPPFRFRADSLRVTTEGDFSQEMGEQYSSAALTSELEEASEIYPISQGERPKLDSLIRSLNCCPDPVFWSTSAKEPQFRIIGWGQWAAFFQRHLCHAIETSFTLLRNNPSDNELASRFESDCDARYSSLLLYPFVKVCIRTNSSRSNETLLEIEKLAASRPELISPACWAEFQKYEQLKHSFQQTRTGPTEIVWSSQAVPYGTAYDIAAILETLRGTPRYVCISNIEQLRVLAPYDRDLTQALLDLRYNRRPTREQALDLYKPVLPYSAYALQILAGTIADNTAECEKTLRAAASINPLCYLTLGDYAVRRGDMDSAVAYYDQGCNAHLDSARSARYAVIRVEYHFKHGDPGGAVRVIDQTPASSEPGLLARARYFELNTNWDKAFTFYREVESSYSNSTPLINFCTTYQFRTGDSRFDEELRRRLTLLFPEGLRNDSLESLETPPTDGVLVKQENKTTLSFGIREGDIIVGVDGFRVQNFPQYAYCLHSTNRVDMDLTIWHQSKYIKIRASPPNHRFGVEMANYLRPDS